jgi:hypothetical protein
MSLRATAAAICGCAPNWRICRTCAFAAFRVVRVFAASQDAELA